MAGSCPNHDIRITRDIAIPMRDGIILRADVYRPRTAGRYPVLVGRVGYKLRDWPMDFYTTTGEYYARRGYVVVWQNVRGTFASQGSFHPYRDDAWGINRDGYDTIEWAGSQAWSSGQIGMIGASYSGLTQYLVAPTRPQHLKALFAEMGWGSARAMMYRDGVHMLHLTAWWPLGMVLHHLEETTTPGIAASTHADLRSAVEDAGNPDRPFSHTSLQALHGLADWYFKDLDHPQDGPYWWSTDLATRYRDVSVPIVHWNGWFDYRLDATLNSFSGIRTLGHTEVCRHNQRLIIGPWGHLGMPVGSVDFGSAAVLDVDVIRLNWYDYWLKGVENGVLEEPPVRIFLMGANRWLWFSSWPPTEVTYEPVFLRRGEGKSERSLNNGALTFEAPRYSEEPESYIFDPEEPLPSLRSFADPGPRDYRYLESRMLTFTSAVLDQDLTIIGPVKAVLYAQSSARDTDWLVRLCDVWPDGKSLSVCDGILRARYRNSQQVEDLLDPGQIYRFDVDMWATAQVFKAGHRLRVQITSSDYPWYDLNPNTGDPIGEVVQVQSAQNTIYHDALHPSHLVIPVMPG